MEGTTDQDVDEDVEEEEREERTLHMLGTLTQLLGLSWAHIM